MDTRALHVALKEAGQVFLANTPKIDTHDTQLLGQALAQMAVLAAEQKVGGVDNSARILTCERTIALIRAKYGVRAGKAQEKILHDLADKGLSLAIRVLIAAVAV